MRKVIAALLDRHEPPVDGIANLKAGLAAIVGIGIVGQLAVLTGLPLLLAPLGATAGLLFGQPTSPLSQPINVMGGYLIAAIVCEIAAFAVPGDWLAAAVAVGAAIVAMRALRVTHPPAAALPLLGVGGRVHGVELFTVVFIGCVVLILLAVLAHRIPPRRNYPTVPE